MWTALVLSVALNLLIIGLTASAAWHMRHGAAADAFAMHGRLASFVSTLPRERKEALRETINAAQPTLRPLRQDASRARREAASVFVAEPFDKVQFANAQSRVFEAELKLRRAQFDLMTEIAGQLTAEEKQAFLKWRPLRGRGSHHGKKPPADEGESGGIGRP
jgi:uncharacterized membrane protein